MRDSFRGLKLAVLPLLIYPAFAIADENGYLTEEDIGGDLYLTTSVTHLPQRLADAPVAVTIIDREMISASGAISPVEIFRMIPGFHAYYPTGNSYGINYHALGDEFPRRMEIKVDGRPVYEPIFSSVEWISLGIEKEDIEYIEAVRGPNQAADGTNAFFGTINIVTRSPVGDSGTSVRGTVGYAKERRISVVHKAKLGDVHNRFTFSHETNEGFPDFEGQELDDGLKATHGGWRGIWTASAKDTVDFQAGLTLSTNGIGAGGDGGSADEVRPRQYTYTYQSAQWERKQNEVHEFQLIFYHNWLEIEEDNVEIGRLSDFLPVPPELDFEFEQIEIKARSQRVDLEFRHLLNLSNEFRMNWGAAARHDRAKGAILFGDDDWVSEDFYRLYTNLEWRPVKVMTFNFGIMGESNDIVAPYVSPRVSVNLHPSPEHTFRFSYTRGIRSPSLLEANQLQVYEGFMEFNNSPLAPALCPIPAIQPFCDYPQYEVVSDPDIEKEEITNIELGYYGHLPLHGLTLDFKVFHEDISSIIDERTHRDVPGDLDGDIVVRTNSADLKTYGYEIGLDYRPISQLLIAAQYSYITLDGDRHKRTSPHEFKTLTKTVPERVFNLLFRYTLPHEIDLGFNYFSQTYVDWLRGDEVEPFNRFDIRAAHRFQFGKTSGQIEFIVQNVFNQDYAEYHHFNNFERRPYLRVSLDWP